MEKNKEIKATLDSFTKKYVQEIPQEEPSIDFTKSIMNTILKEKEVEFNFTKQKELITKKGWFLITGFLFIMTVLAFKIVNKTTLILIDFNIDFFDKTQSINVFEFYTASNSVSYAIFFFGLMVIAQTFFLKKYFERRI